LHPGADQRNELSAEEKLEIAVAQGPKCGGKVKPARLGGAVVVWRMRRGHVRSYSMMLVGVPVMQMGQSR